MTQEDQYLDLVRWVRASDQFRPDRTQTGTQGRFGGQMRFDLAEGFPLLTTKQVHLKSIVHELLWFLAGDTNNNTLRSKGVKIWDDWAVFDKHELSLKERYQFFLDSKGDEEFDQLRFEAPDFGSDDDRHAVLDSKGIPRYAQGPRDGELGPVYGAQWRRWRDTRVIDEHDDLQPWLAQGYVEQGRGFNLRQGRSFAVVEKEIDQIAELIHNLRTKPFSRRHVVTAWNPADLPDESKPPQVNAAAGRQALASCHCLFQFYVGYRELEEIAAAASAEHQREYSQWLKTVPSAAVGDYKTVIQQRQQAYQFFEERGYRTKRLSCHLYQRSADVALGVPFNIASYALLTMMVAQVTGMVAGDFVHSFGDLHLYVNHLQGADAQLARKPYALPKMWINPAVTEIDDFKFEDFRLEGYTSHEKIVFPIAV